MPIKHAPECSPGVMKPVFFVVGSTGSGKSVTAIRLAQSLNKLGYQETVVINCDVMQFYSVLPIATNKASLDEMEGIPHTFLGFLSPDDEMLRDPETPCGPTQRSDHRCARDGKPTKRFDIHSFTERATAFIVNYFESNPRGAVIVCGGTSYYAEALMLENSLTPTDTAPDEDTVAGASSDVSDGALWDALNSVDPVVAQRYHPNDTRRLKRLLEIHKVTGKLPSDLFSAKKASLRFGGERTFLVWSFLDNNALFPALDRRVDTMVKKGLIEEVRDFYELTRTHKPTTSIAEAIGYREYEAAISSGTADEEATKQMFIATVKADTRRYARQQVRWIKNRFVRLLKDTELAANHFAKVDATRLESLSFQTLVDALCANRAEGAPVPGVSYPLLECLADADPITQEMCEICGTPICGRNQMVVHLKSKRHRGAVKRARMKASFEETFGRPLPPSKKRKPQ